MKAQVQPSTQRSGLQEILAAKADESGISDSCLHEGVVSQNDVISVQPFLPPKLSAESVNRRQIF
jgi:hypothetical protein